MTRRTALGLGAIQIQNDVIGSIAAMAAQEVPGVVGVWRGPWWKRLLGGGTGVSVESRDQEVRLVLRLIVEYGVSLSEVAAEVQERVREVVEKMTQLIPVDLQVNIQEVRPKHKQNSVGKG